MAMTALGWTAAEVATIVAGRLVGESRPIDRVVVDSRRAVPGALFVALPGTRTDGHLHAPEAVERGGVALVAAGRGVSVEPRIEVGDPLTALRDLAAAHRANLDLPTVGITGSTGKTSTKALLAAALPGAVVAPRSYNNEIGVPLTVLAAHGDATGLVLEVGSRGRGHIRWLLPAVRPDVAVITNLGLVHLETFGTEADLADAKWELAEGVGPDGTVVVPVDEPRLRRAHPGRVVTFGASARADVAYSSVRLDEELRPRFRLHVGGETREVLVGLRGAHQAANAAAAVAAALALGRELDDVVGGLAEVTAPRWRMELRRGRYLVVNDAYNANPDSVAAALEAVTHLPGRRIAVLGTMAELGAVAEREHRRIGALAAELGYRWLVAVGATHGMAEAAGDIAVEAADADEAYTILRGLLRPGDVVLVKGSRAAGLEGLADRLAEEADA